MRESMVRAKTRAETLGLRHNLDAYLPHVDLDSTDAIWEHSRLTPKAVAPLLS